MIHSKSKEKFREGDQKKMKRKNKKKRSRGDDPHHAFDIWREKFYCLISSHRFRTFRLKYVKKMTQNSLK